MRYIIILAAAAALSIANADQLPQQAMPEPVEEVWTPQIPAALAGPFIVDPKILASFDGDSFDCDAPGHELKFACLIYRDGRSGIAPSQIKGNPFKQEPGHEDGVFSEIAKTVKQDLQWIRTQQQFGGSKAVGISTGFLDFDGADIELVGVVNRMDRQFNRDEVPEHRAKLACGEISAIYRFGYRGALEMGASEERRYGSRLPVTMNVVFSARPWSKSVSCSTVAANWLDYARSMKAGASISTLREKAQRAISTLRPADIDRIELNMQGSRVSASADDAAKNDEFRARRQPDGTDFGTLATYIMRVFRWDKVDRTHGHWHTSYLTNQIDRVRLLGLEDDGSVCAEQRTVKIKRKQLVDYLLSMEEPKPGRDTVNGIGDVDNGILNIPQRFLACRAISISPGGSARSMNQPFWNTADVNVAIISDAEINDALKAYRRRYSSASLGFVGTADEFRTRLNDQSCSGCHQSRAIAGFHFPGADVAGTSPVNAVYLPGSPHFFGDQPRRMEILEKIAAGNNPQGGALATSYAMRPLNSFRALTPDPKLPARQRMQLIGGWGGACMMKRSALSKRQWGCAAGLECQAVFASDNHPNLGVCLNPRTAPQLGDAMQFGNVRTERFGFDVYSRSLPSFGQTGRNGPRNTAIDTSWIAPRKDNSWFAAHQENFDGFGPPGRSETLFERASRIRDQGTGGFPGGSLRLSECTDLPGEATCALLASSGFNDCIKEVKDRKRTPESCFRSYTNYAGVRACDPANPCRDDYICLSPMRYLKTDATAKRKLRDDARAKEAIENPVLASSFNDKTFGEAGPDTAWLNREDGRGDRRGVCIPPYFVFQFRADGHVVPRHR